MKNQEEVSVATVSIPFSGKLGVFIAITIGLLLLLIGYDTRTEGLVFTGTFILPLTLIWGGLFLTRESGPIRVTLLVFGLIILTILLSTWGVTWFSIW